MSIYKLFAYQDKISLSENLQIRQIGDFDTGTKRTNCPICCRMVGNLVGKYSMKKDIKKGISLIP